MVFLTTYPKDILYKMNNVLRYFDIVNDFFCSIPETLVNIIPTAIVSYFCLNLAITPIFVACQTQLMLSVFAVLFFFINVALILILVGLEYLGLAVLLVYAGAIIMILLFIIMLVKLQETERQPFSTLPPIQWGSGSIIIQEKHVTARSLFLIGAVVLGACILTFNCKSIVSELIPYNQLNNTFISPSLESYSVYSGQTEGATLTKYIGQTNLRYSTQMPLFDTYFDTQSPNYIPWLFTYFNTLLELKFQPIVLENTAHPHSWPYLMLDYAPSYNLDRWTLNLVGDFGRLNELLPAYTWTRDVVGDSVIPSTGDSFQRLLQLINPESSTKSWDFYPRTRYGVFDFPKQPMGQLLYNTDIYGSYAAEYELKDRVCFPLQDISNISSSLYTKNSPTLVLASLCLFIAMVLSFLLTDFKIKHEE